MRRIDKRNIKEEFSRYSSFKYENNIGVVNLYEQESSDGLDTLQNIFDYISIGLSIGSIPIAATGFGVPVAGGMNIVASTLDLINGVIYLSKGEYIFATMSFISVVPLVGDSAKIGFNSIVKIVGGPKNLKKIMEGGSQLSPEQAKILIKKVDLEKIKSLSVATKSLFNITMNSVKMISNVKLLPKKEFVIKTLLKGCNNVTKGLTNLFKWISPIKFNDVIKHNERVIRTLNNILKSDDIISSISKFKISKKFVPKYAKVVTKNGLIVSPFNQISKRVKEFGVLEKKIQDAFIKNFKKNNILRKEIFNNDPLKTAEKISNLSKDSTSYEELAKNLIANGHDSYFKFMEDILLDRKKISQIMDIKVVEGVAEKIYHSNIFKRAVNMGNDLKDNITPGVAVVTAGGRMIKTLRVLFTHYLDENKRDDGYIDKIDNMIDVLVNNIKKYLIPSELTEKLKDSSLSCLIYYDYAKQEVIDDKNVYVINDEQYGIKYVFYMVTTEDGQNYLKSKIFSGNNEVAQSTDLRCRAGSKQSDPKDIKISAEQLDEHLVRNSETGELTKYIRIGPILIGLRPEEYEKLRQSAEFNEVSMPPIETEKEKLKNKEKEKKQVTSPEQEKLNKKGNPEVTNKIIRGDQPEKEKNKTKITSNIKRVISDDRLISLLNDIEKTGNERSIEIIAKSSQTPKEGVMFGKTSEGNDFALFKNVKFVSKLVVDKALKDLERNGIKVNYNEEITKNFLERHDILILLNDEIEEKIQKNPKFNKENLKQVKE